MSSNKFLSDSERREMIDKLNKETEDFVKQAKAKNYKYEDGFTDENIDEILATHPAFINKQPTQEEIDASPLLSAMQDLKYNDPDDSNYDKAMAYKADGNVQFKVKKYRAACAAYSEGIKMKCDDTELQAVLYANRAAANYHLQNFRSALLDASYSVKLLPDRIKSLIRCAQCCEALSRFKDAIEWCSIILSLDNENSIAMDMKKSCTEKLKVAERNNRKQKLAETKLKQKAITLYKTVISRGIFIKDDLDLKNASDDEPKWLNFLENMGPTQAKVHINENKALVWPVLFVYPEYQVTDFIECFEENHSFFDHLMVMFDNFADWDTKHDYSPETVSVFYESCIDSSILMHVSKHKSLLDTLKNSSYTVRSGTPNFMIISEKSKFYSQFLQRYKSVMKC